MLSVTVVLATGQPAARPTAITIEPRLSGATAGPATPPTIAVVRALAEVVERLALGVGRDLAFGGEVG
jgi:hypothetical protein